MLGDRTPSEEAEREPERRGRRRPLLLLVVAIVGALAVALGVRRREESTLEPPF